ncbi:hypothetical protein [Dactylosporangium darangshiense]|uniref:hypothetical protein n=1 Tax=Dactylosporangium darangshiense TaxID=579108 RepID=UPI0031E5CA1A
MWTSDGARRADAVERGVVQAEQPAVTRLIADRHFGILVACLRNDDLSTSPGNDHQH